MARRSILSQLFRQSVGYVINPVGRFYATFRLTDSSSDAFVFSPKRNKDVALRGH